MHKNSQISTTNPNKRKKLEQYAKKSLKVPLERSPLIVSLLGRKKSLDRVISVRGMFVRGLLGVGMLKFIKERIFCPGNRGGTIG